MPSPSYKQAEFMETPEDYDVLAAVDLGSNSFHMIIARLRRNHTVDQPACRLEVEHRDLCFQQRRLDPLPFPRRLARRRPAVSRRRRPVR